MLYASSEIPNTPCSCRTSYFDALAIFWIYSLLFTCDGFPASEGVLLLPVIPTAAACPHPLTNHSLTFFSNHSFTGVLSVFVCLLFFLFCLGFCLHLQRGNFSVKPCSRRPPPPTIRVVVLRFALSNLSWRALIFFFFVVWHPLSPDERKS